MCSQETILVKERYLARLLENVERTVELLASAAGLVIPDTTNAFENAGHLGWSESRSLLQKLAYRLARLCDDYQHNHTYPDNDSVRQVDLPCGG